MHVSRALVITTALFASFCLGCASTPAPSADKATSLDYYVTSASSRSAVVVGFPNADHEGEPSRFSLYNNRGVEVWHVLAQSAEILHAGSGTAAAWAQGLEADGSWTSVRLCLIDNAGRSKTVGYWPRGYVVPLHVGRDEVTYVVADGDSMRIFVRRGARLSTLRLALPGPLYSWAASTDGSRVALISPGLQASQYTLTWVRIAPAGDVRIARRSTLTVNSYVALDAPGRRTVLGGVQPVLGVYGQSEGRRLPLSYVSQAVLSRTRTFIMRFWTADDREFQRGMVLDFSGKRRWHLELEGSGCSMRADASVRFVAFRRDSSAPWELVDLSTGALDEAGRGVQ